MRRDMMQLSVTGARELGGNMIGLGRSVSGDRLERAALAGGQVVANDATRRAPKKTGRGARSIQARVVRSEPEEVEVAVGPGRREFYMMFQEIGTSYFPAQPFLRPALDNNFRQAQVQARKVFWQAINQKLVRSA